MKDTQKMCVMMVAILCITVLESINMLTEHVDGAILTLIVTAISGIVGLLFGARHERRRRTKSLNRDKGILKEYEDAG